MKTKLQNKTCPTGLKKLLAVTALCLIGMSNVNAQCTANFTSTTGVAGNVNFTSTSTGTNATTTYYWDFGDGNIFYGVNNPLASHTYSYNATFSVMLIIQDSIGAACTSSITKTLTVSNAACLGTASFANWQGAGGLVNFISTSTGIAPNSTYWWYFGDGTNQNTGTNNFTTHTYTVGGTYNAILVITNTLTACNYSVAQSLSVSIVTCSLNANYSFTNGLAGNVNFASTSTGTTINTNYYWNFGDGFGGNGAITSHTYTNNGSYNVLLTVTDSTGLSCTDTITKVVNISNAPCFANPSFYIQKDSLNLFTWKAFPIFPVNVLTASWSWGDGTSTTGLYPSHTYSAAGWYNICLSMTVTCGASNTLCILSNIFKMQSPASGMVYINVINQAAGVNSLSKETDKLNLYPNPNNGEFKLEISGVNANSNDIEISVYNLLGEKVYTTKHELINGSLSSNINLNEIPNGAYFIKAITSGKTYTVKTIINR